MAKISSLYAIGKEWFVVFDDSDSQTDYFHSTRGSQKYITETIVKYGGDIIEVTIQNGHETQQKSIKGVERLAKNCGYTSEFIQEKVTSLQGEKWIKEYMILRKVKQ